jgi:two-component system, response regulator PdtaR
MEFGGDMGGGLMGAKLDEDASTNRKTILVVEDEVIIRFDIGDYLRTHGYEVIEANSAAEAIQVLRNSSFEVSAVFTDVRMPGTIDGIDLARYVQTHHPDIPVLVTSGHISPDDLPPEFGPLITKPYSRAEVLKAIEERLNRS